MTKVIVVGAGIGVIQWKRTNPTRIAFENYFLNMLRKWNTEPTYENHILRCVGIERSKK